MTIRKTREEDMPRIMEIFSIAKAFMRQKGNMHQWNGSYPDRDAIIRDMGRGWSHVITDDSDRPIATFCMMDAPEPTYNRIYDGRWLNDEPYVVLHRVASDGSVPRTFHAMVEYAATRYNNLRVDTHRENIPMQEALIREGFSRCGVIFLADGSDRIAFQRDSATL